MTVMTLHRGPSLSRILIPVALAVLSIGLLIPLVWLALAPSKTNPELVTQWPLSFGSLTNYLTAWQNVVAYNGGIVYRWAANTVLYTVSSTILAVASCWLAGYALATTRIVGRRVILIATLIAMIVPATALVLPLFLEFAAVRLINTPASVILPAALFPFGTYLAFIYFTTSLPKELLEAGRIDGASELRLLTSVVLPISMPLVGLLTFFSFTTSWANYFLPYVMLSKESLYNLPVGLGALMSSTPALNPSGGGGMTSIGRVEIAVTGLVLVAPVAIAFILAQRRLTSGVLDGSVK